MYSFEPQHYVPILRWKQAERGALSQLDTRDLPHITPLIELIPENFVQRNTRLHDDAAMYSIASQLMKSWGERPIYIDLPNLAPALIPQSGKCLSLLTEYVGLPKLSIIPVTGLHREPSYNIGVQNVIDSMNQGVCLRLTLDDVRSATFDRSVSNLLDILSLKCKEVDLLVDYQIIDKSSPGFKDLGYMIQDVDKWRNFIVTGGAFPEDLTAYRKNQQHSIPRLDWISWRDQAIDQHNETRLPNFSDYTIQFPRYVPRRRGLMRYSASIRYTSEDNWVIMRGENVFKEGGPGFHQYPDLAIMLCDLPQYCGERYSEGDRYIKEISLQKKETGAAPQWLQAGINHHITYATRQLATLNDSPPVSLS